MLCHHQLLDEPLTRPPHPCPACADLLVAHAAHAGAALTCRGWVAPDACTYEPELGRSVYGHKLPAGASVPTDVVTGSDAYLLQPSVFARDDSLWTFPSSTVRAAAKMDDVWISGQLAAKGVPRMVAYCTHEARDAAPQLISHGRIRHGSQSRDELNSILLQYFCPYWLHSVGSGSSDGSGSSSSSSSGHVGQQSAAEPAAGPAAEWKIVVGSTGGTETQSIS